MKDVIRFIRALAVHGGMLFHFSGSSCLRGCNIVRCFLARTWSEREGRVTEIIDGVLFTCWSLSWVSLRPLAMII